jgi:hypothetical protein
VTDSKAPTLDEAVALVDKARERAATMLEKIFAAAQPGAVYGQPVGAERYTVITAAEVTSGGGFGMAWARARRPGRAAGPHPRRRRRRPGTGRPAGPAASAGAVGPWADRSRSSPSARTG